MKRNVVVLGAGIIGLSCALSLSADPSNNIYVVAEAFTPDTTSDGAGAIWEPYEAQPQELIRRWSATTKDELTRLAKEGWPIYNCKIEKPIAPGTEFKPYWKDMVDNLTLTDRMRNGHHIMTYESPVIKTTPYMERLMDLLRGKDVKFVRYHIFSVDSLLRIFPWKVDIFVNCLGLSAGTLFNDKEVFPIHGFMIHLKPQPQLGFYHLRHLTPQEITVVINRDDVCLLGGTKDIDAQPLVKEGEFESIIKRCVHWCPELLENGDVESQLISFWVGIRPGRKSIRLELDESLKFPIVHCYGHGGSGWTVHWGCAEDVSQIVKKYFSKSKM